MMNEEDKLIKILQLSHRQVLAGKSYSQEEAERFLDQGKIGTTSVSQGMGIQYIQPTAKSMAPNIPE